MSASKTKFFQSLNLGLGEDTTPFAGSRSIQRICAWLWPRQPRLVAFDLALPSYLGLGRTTLGTVQMSLKSIPKGTKT